MRILVGGLSHESNTFNPIITGEEDFVVFRDRELLDPGLLKGSSIRGIVGTLGEEGAEVVPLFFGRGVPNGLVSASFYQNIKDDFLTLAREALREGPIQGICLALHGSMKIQGKAYAGEPLCAEEDLCTAMRALFPGIPMVIALDMHATITPGFLAAVDGVVGYKTAPHTDAAETGAHAARILLKAMNEGLRIGMAHRYIPMMIAGEKSETEAEPMASLIAACRRAENEPGIEAASLLLGFPWADDPHNGATVLLTYTEGGHNSGPSGSPTYIGPPGMGLQIRDKAEQLCAEIARSFWERRGEFQFRTEWYDTRESVETAFTYAEAGERPVFISDSGDNPTAGATADATDLLEALLDTMKRAEGLPSPILYSGFFDAPAAAACIEAGEGGELDITVGGNWDRINGRKVPLRVRVDKVVRAYEPFRSDLVLVRHKKLLLVISSRHIGFGDPELLPALGLRAEDYCIVAVKLGYLEPCFKAIAKKAILATTRGCSNEVIESLPYHRVRRPIYPLDEDMEIGVYKM
ncbi:MAG: M81 family metallopeptidase [Treponema sp.]|nr:M81 family metallopeptidase [Treponema sp.]